MKNQNFVYTICLSVVLTTVLAGCGNSTTDTTQVKDNSQQTSTTTGSNTVTTTDSTTTTTTSDQGDVRVYEGTGSYTSPAGNENVDVKISYADGKITDVDLTSDTTHPNSKRYQGLFLEGLKTQIIGKSINDLNVSGNVNGSSLTANGFNQALDKIKAQVKS